MLNYSHKFIAQINLKVLILALLFKNMEYLYKKINILNLLFYLKIKIINGLQVPRRAKNSYC